MKSPVIPVNDGKQLGHAQGGQQPIAGATIQLWQVNTTADGGLGTAMLTGTVTTSDGSGNVTNSNANAGNLFNTLPAGYFLITGMYTCPVGDALVYITASGGNPGLTAGTNNPQSKLVTALGSCNNLKANVQSINISEQTTVGTVAALYAFMSAYNAIGASPAHTTDLAASFARVNEYINFQAGTAPGSALPAGYSASTGDVNLLANVLAACVNSLGGTYYDGSPCGTLFYYASSSSTNPSTDVTAAALFIRKNYTESAGNIATLATPQAPFEPADTASPPDWTLPIFELPSTPTFSPAPGTYSGIQQVRILEANPAAAIYYSFNGATPSVDSPYYSGVITVSSSKTINAIAVAARGRATSAVGSAAYTITGVPTNAPAVAIYSFTLGVGSTTPVRITAFDSSSDSSVVTFGVSGALGGSFSPLTCTISGGECSVMYTPTGSAAPGTYTNAVTASFSAAGGYTSATVMASVYIIPATTFTPLVGEDTLNTSLIQASDGYFYGVDPGYGSGGSGIIFKMDSSGNITPVYTFTGAANGLQPADHLIQGTDGFFYGVTTAGGTSGSSTTLPAGSTGNGTVFRIDAAGNFTLLYNFTGTFDGGAPQGSLVQGTDGSFYGVAEAGGGNGFGTIFKIDATGDFTLLHSFARGTDGGGPRGSLLQGADGTFYGTTTGGGTYDFGTIYKMDASGNVTTLYSFTGAADGTDPYTGLVQGADGQLYGTALFGGTVGGGTVYKVDTSGNFTLLHGFSGTEGDRPEGLLVEGSDGSLYGTTSYSGPVRGSIFKIDHSSGFTLEYDFTGQYDGSAPSSGLLQASDGSFYGTTSTGGASDSGTVFKLAPAPALAGPVTLSVPSSVTHGTSFTLTYSVANASSATLQHCFATNTGGDASGWTGIKTASTSATNATLTAPASVGTYTYTLTCGGVESGFAILDVN